MRRRQVALLADLVALACAAGCDPLAGAEAFRDLLRMRQGSDRTPNRLSTHPPDGERIANIRRLSAEADRRFAGESPIERYAGSTPRWAELVSGLRGG